MRRISFLLIAAAALVLAGCALDSDISPAHAEGALPWNRPQSWEGAGAMGAAMQGTP
jgi:outer membrane biogenesis lipoprotein LolB